MPFLYGDEAQAHRVWGLPLFFLAYYVTVCAIHLEDIKYTEVNDSLG